MVFSPLISQRGSFQPLFLLFLLLVFSTGIGLWLLFHRWSGIVHLQLNLDRCVGARAQELQTLLNRIDQTNLAMQTLRAGEILTVFLLPKSTWTLRESLNWLAFYQDGLLKKWQFQTQRWKISRPCINWKAKFFDWFSYSATPLPQMHYVRPPPDALGKNPLSWKGVEPRPSLFRIQAEVSSRASAAEVYQEKSPLPLSPWKAEWTLPKRGERVQSQ